MKKLFFLLLTMLMSVSILKADDVSVEQALQTALQFAENSPTANSALSRKAASVFNPRLAYSVKSELPAAKDNVYIINLGEDQGFVIVSGMTGTDGEVLGYCDHGSFSYDNCPIQLKDILALYSAGIDSLRQNPALILLQNPTQIATARGTEQYPSNLGTVIVEPLLTSSWDQSSPYNNLCPVVTEEGAELGYALGSRYSAGCVPVAIGQIMRYWRWPESTTGTVYGKDFSGHTYDWDNMLDDYSQGYNATQADAVAKLLADVGTAMGTHYGAPTGSSTTFSPLALIENFGFHLDCTTLSGINALSLKDAIIAELTENRPVPYAGGVEGSSHALVCDGYTDKSYFHFNYGWGGSFDGWYKLSSVPRYSRNSTIWKNFRPYDARQVVIDGVKYGLLKNGTAEIIEYVSTSSNKENGDLVIPNTVEHEGSTYQVTRIRQRAFFSKGNFGKVTLGENIRNIDAFSFFYTRIDELVLSDKMETVPDEAFQLTNIKTLTIGENIKRIGKKAFYMCPLTTVTSKSPNFVVGEEAFGHTRPDCGEWLSCITSLGKAAFKGASFNGSAQFSQLVEIGDSAFFGATFPKNYLFTVAPSVRTIASSAFHNSGVARITVDSANPYFTTEMGFYLLNANKTSLILTLAPPEPIGISISPFPSTMIRLEPGSIGSRPYSGSYEGQSFYKSVTIPATVYDMEGAFKDCSTLSSLTCLAVTPPPISDATFNDKIFENSPDARLSVPEGTANLYRNAPGWRRFTNIVEDQPYNPVPAQALQYNMVVDTDDGQHLSIPMSEVSSMEISKDGKQLIIKRNGKDDITTTITGINNITWKPGFVYENAEIFDLNEETLTAKAQKCTITFDATVIDEDVQLCVRNSVLTPSVIEGVTRGFSIDLSLSNGQHELYGTAEITIPVNPGPDEEVCAAYYNEETGEWEPVYYEYDKNAGTVTITTDHLSNFALFFVINPMTTLAALQTYKSLEATYNTLFTMKEAAVKLLQIVQSEIPETEAVLQFKDEMALWQSVGLDGLWAAVRGTGEAIWDFRPEKLDAIADGFGYLGLALSILDIARAEANGDDIGVAAGSLKTILGYSTMMAGKAIATPVFSVSMAMVAFVGIALEKFGTKVQTRKHDIYKAIYNLFYSRAGKNDPDIRSCYRSPKDWYKLFYPVVAEGNMTESEWMAYIKEEVTDYCNQLWDQDKYELSYHECYTKTKARFPFTSYAWPEPSMRKTLSDEHFAELMNGELVSVITAIKNHQKTEAAKRVNKALKDIADMMNTNVGLHIVDSEWKEGETSKYAGWKIAFSEIPGSLKDGDNLRKTLNEKGRAGIGWFTEYALVHHGIPTQLTLYDKDDNPQKTYNFQLPEGTGKVILTIDLATGGEKADTQPLDGLELTYDPDRVEYPMEIGGHGYGGDQYLYFDNAFNQRARFQTGIEKFFNRHNFITVDKFGNFKIGDDINGSFEGNGLEATGKFTIEASHKFVEKTINQYIHQVANPTDKYEWVHGLLDGIIQHQIECEYKITRKSVDSNEYEINYTGTGEFALLGNFVVSVEGVDPEALVNCEGQEISPSDITTRELSFDGNVTLKYSTTLK